MPKIKDMDPKDCQSCAALSKKGTCGAEGLGKTECPNPRVKEKVGK